MPTASLQTSLAFERRGAGTPIVLLPGLTFDRRSWRPIVDRLGDDVCTIAIDLPAHGASPGPPCDLEAVAARVHGLLDGLGVADPIVVGHSMSGAVALIYAARYPVRGAVSVEAPVNVGPFAEMVQYLEPALRGPGFADVFARFEQSMGLSLVPEPLRSVALESHEVRREVVLGYWDQLMRSDADRLQARVEELAGRIDVPVLALFGQRLAAAERDYLRRLVRGAQLEEWPGRGHFVHLADADRFAARLLGFADFCNGVSS
jgi:pimeloyl-ACP methyl ester carboxylesterase